MCGYTLTADMSKAGKIKATAGQSARHRVAMHVQHVARGVDTDGQGFLRIRSFRNPDIDPARTSMNQGYVNDGAGGLAEAESIADVMAVYDRYIAALDPSRTIRKDAVHVRGVVLNLDENWWDQECPDWQHVGVNPRGQRMMDALLDSFMDEVGPQHIAWAFLHLDEGVPQWQVGVIPVVDGRLASDRVLPSGTKAMTNFHQHMRARMITAGYEASMESTTRSKDRVPMEEYKRAMRAADAIARDTGERPAQPLLAVNLLDDAVTAAVLDDAVVDEQSFEQALSTRGVRRITTSRGCGTIYEMDDPLNQYDVKAMCSSPGVIRREASSLHSNVTQSVLSEILSKKRSVPAGQVFDVSTRTAVVAVDAGLPTHGGQPGPVAVTVSTDEQEAVPPTEWPVFVRPIIAPIDWMAVPALEDADPAIEGWAACLPQQRCTGGRVPSGQESPSGWDTVGRLARGKGLDEWLDDWAKDEHTSVTALLTARNMCLDDPGDRQVLHEWMRQWQAERDAKRQKQTTTAVAEVTMEESPPQADGGACKTFDELVREHNRTPPSISDTTEEMRLVMSGRDIQRNIEQRPRKLLASTSNKVSARPTERPDQESKRTAAWVAGVQQRVAARSAAFAAKLEVDRVALEESQAARQAAVEKTQAALFPRRVPTRLHGLTPRLEQDSQDRLAHPQVGVTPPEVRKDAERTAREPRVDEQRDGLRDGRGGPELENPTFDVKPRQRRNPELFAPFVEDSVKPDEDELTM